MTVRGKGKKERLALLGPDAVAALSRWLDDRADAAGTIQKETAAVFLNKSGGRLTTRSVGRMLAKHLQTRGARSANQPAHAPAQFRDAHARCRGRHSRGAGTARAQEPDDDPGVHARDDQRLQRVTRRPTRDRD